MTIKTRISPETEFAAARVVLAMSEAPLDGTPIVARHRNGNVAHIRWSVEDEMGPHERPYWARWDTDIEFHPVAWVPTAWSITDILEVYG